jgi:hypothetical protein
MNDIASDLGKDDTGLEDLDESKPLQEIDMKQVIAAAAILLGTAGAPNTAQAQNPIGNLLKKGVTAVQNKLNPQPKIDTVKVQKDAPLQLAKFKDFKGVGYGYAKSPSQSTAYRIAKTNATKDLLQKMGQQQITAGIEEKDIKYYQNPDGTYECEILVIIGNM